MRLGSARGSFTVSTGDGSITVSQGATRLTMHHDEIAAVFATMFVFGAPVLAFIVARVLRHQERIEMLRRGMMPPEFDKRAYRAWRKSGAPWPPPGGPGSRATAQAPWAQPTPANWPSADDDAQRALYKGIRIAAVGLRALDRAVVHRRHRRARRTSAAGRGCSAV